MYTYMYICIYGSTRLSSDSSLPHRCLSHTGESRAHEHLRAYWNHQRCDKRVLTWHVKDAPVQQTQKRVDTSLLGLGIRAFRRELTSTSVRLFLGPNRNVISHATAIHRCASGANASFAPVVRPQPLMWTHTQCCSIRIYHTFDNHDDDEDDDDDDDGDVFLGPNLDNVVH